MSLRKCYNSHQIHFWCQRNHRQLESLRNLFVSNLHHFLDFRHLYFTNWLSHYSTKFLGVLEDNNLTSVTTRRDCFLVIILYPSLGSGKSFADTNSKKPRKINFRFFRFIKLSWKQITDCQICWINTFSKNFLYYKREKNKARKKSVLAKRK